MGGRKLIFAVGVALFLPASVLTDEEAPAYSFTELTTGGKFIFVMLLPKPWRQSAYGSYKAYTDPSLKTFTLRAGRLQNEYRSSGLYRNDGSKTPLWTVDWYSREVWVCSDGQHIVRWGPWAENGDKGQTLALGFYRSGKAVRSYRIADIVADYHDLPYSVSHYMWAKQKSFDDAGKRVKVQLWKGEVRSRSGPTLVFDIRSGSFKQAAASPPRHPTRAEASALLFQRIISWQSHKEEIKA